MKIISYARTPRAEAPDADSTPSGSGRVRAMSHGHSTDRPVPAELAACEVSDENGTKVRLGSLWAERPIVLAFVRHFG